MRAALMAGPEGAGDGNVRSEGESWRLRRRPLRRFDRGARALERLGLRRGPGRIEVTSAVSARLLGAYAASNAALAAETEVDLRRFGYFGAGAGLD